MSEKILEILSDGKPHSVMDISSHFNGNIFNLLGILMVLEINDEIKQLPYDRELGTCLGRMFQRAS